MTPLQKKVLYAVGRSANISGTGPSGLTILHALMASTEVLEAMAQAHDAEDAAQRGEPSPWREDLGADQDPEWRAERRTAMLCALQAVGLA